MKKIFSLFAAVLFAGSMMAAAYEDLFTLDFSSVAATGSSSNQVTDESLLTLLQSAAPATTDIKEASKTSGYVYDGKGSGGGSIPQQILKIGKASDGGAISFTIADKYAKVAKVEIVGYAWKKGTSVSVNSSAVQSPAGDNEVQVEKTFTYELGKDSTKTIAISVATSALCVKKIKLYKTGNLDEPSISANDVNFGTVYVPEGETSATIVKKLTVTGANLGETAITATPSDHVAVAGTLTAEGGELTLTITAAVGDFSEKITLASGETTKEVTVSGKVAAVHEYNVAEAIAASLATNDFVGVKGVVTKIDLKPSNFKTYGSANIYVADATGAAGEFEYYNCYSLQADTFKTIVPEQDMTSTSWVSVTSVTDGNSNTVAVGDTVVAWGKYTYYNSTSTHELNTGCYLVSIKSPVVPTAIDNAAVEGKAVKFIENGVLYIEKAGVRYNVMGQAVK